MRSATPSEAFSLIAPSYDREFGLLDPVPELRQRVLSLLMKHAPPGGRLLEIGAGTGDDAKALYEAGFAVTATDVSPGMLVEAEKKLAGTPVPIRTLGAEEVPGAFPSGSFEVLFSNFGALNCVADLPGLLPQLGRLLTPGGIMVICLLGKYPLWEMTAAMGRLRFRDAYRRVSRSVVLARVGTQAVPVWYHSLAAVRSACRGWGTVIDVEGLNVVSPPPNSRSFSRRFPRVTSLLDHFDRTVGTLPLLATLGDHIVIVIRSAHTGQAGGHDH